MSGFHITITTGSGTPIYRQIIEQVKLGVATGTLPRAMPCPVCAAWPSSNFMADSAHIPTRSHIASL